ncbi:MAG: hypothetical protein JXB50_14200 [Spirochaetes bacterium]|nr:hypothetical protein [Spirochaetota bacterium]
MKRMIFLFLLFTCSKSISQESINDWFYSKNIQSFGSNKYKYFFIDKDIYKFSNDNLSDIRIVDESNGFIPYYINEGFKEEKIEDIIYISKQINKSNEKIKDTSIINTIFDFQIFNDKEDYGVNKIEIEVLQKKEFSNQIEIYGRNEKSDWFFITKDTLYNINQYKKNIFNFDFVHDYNFFRVVILNNKENIDIKKFIPVLNIVEKKYNSYKEGTELKFEIKNEKDISKITIKNPDKLKIMELSINSQGNFNRKYELQKKDGFYITSGSLYNFEHNDIKISNIKISLNFRNFKYDEFSLNLFNNNDLPLKITKINAVYILDKIIFENINNNNYKVLFGNPQALKPSYDIASFKNYIENETMDKLALGELVILKHPGVQKKKFNYKFFFNIIIFMVSLSLIIMLVYVLKKK